MPKLDGRDFDPDLREPEFPLSAALYERATGPNDSDLVMRALKAQGMEDLAREYINRRQNISLSPMEIEMVRMFRHIFRRKHYNKRVVDGSRPNGRLCIHDAEPLTGRQQYYCSHRCEVSYRATGKPPYILNASDLNKAAVP